MKPNQELRAVVLRSFLLFFGLMSLGLDVKAEYINDIYYMCAAWGPDLDAEEPGKADEVIYFVKQICFKHKSGGMVNSLGSRLWFCKMNWDGSNKKEICELWPGQNAFVDINGNAMWLDVCAATKQAAFSIEYGNLVGLWVIGLDGRNLHQPFPRIWNDKEKWATVHPSWSPDGKRFVFCEIDRKEKNPYAVRRRLAIFDLTTTNRTQITNDARDEHPVWSPKDDWIAYTHFLEYNDRKAITRLWLIKSDGSESHPILDEKGKQINGEWPAWSPDGSKISFSARGLWMAGVTSNFVTHLNKGRESPWSWTNQHWGKHGWLESYGFQIRLCEREDLYDNPRWVGAGGSITVAQGRDLATEEARWGYARWPPPATNSPASSAKTAR